MLLELHINYAHTHTQIPIHPHWGAHIMRCLFARQAVIIIMIIIAVILIMHCCSCCCEAILHIRPVVGGEREALPVCVRVLHFYQ